MSALVPAISEPELANQPTASRLAVIIDLLRYLTGAPINSATPSGSASFGVAGVPFTSANASAADAAITDVPTVGLHIVLDSIVISVDTTMNVLLKEETSGTVIYGPVYMLANTSIHIDPKPNLQLPTINRRLMVRTSVAGNIMAAAQYYSN